MAGYGNVAHESIGGIVGAAHDEPSSKRQSSGETTVREVGVAAMSISSFTASLRTRARVPIRTSSTERRDSDRDRDSHDQRRHWANVPFTVYANVASGINDVAGIRGHSLGFGLAVSTSNFLVPAAELRRRGVHPLTGPQKITFLGTLHDRRPALRITG